MYQHLPPNKPFANVIEILTECVDSGAESDMSVAISWPVVLFSAGKNIVCVNAKPLLLYSKVWHQFKLIHFPLQPLQTRCLADVALCFKQYSVDSRQLGCPVQVYGMF